MKFGSISGSIWDHFVSQNACKKQSSFFNKKGNEISLEREPKGTPRGPQGDPKIKDLGSRLAPSSPGAPQRIANGAKTSTFNKNRTKMHSKSVPHFANYDEINAESFVKRVVLLLEPANSFRQRRRSKDKSDEAKDPKRRGL